jgi:hypothetical protein
MDGVRRVRIPAGVPESNRASFTRLSSHHDAYESMFSIFCHVPTDLPAQEATMMLVPIGKTIELGGNNETEAKEMGMGVKTTRFVDVQTVDRRAILMVRACRLACLAPSTVHGNPEITASTTLSHFVILPHVVTMSHLFQSRHELHEKSAGAGPRTSTSAPASALQNCLPERSLRPSYDAVAATRDVITF